MANSGCAILGEPCPELGIVDPRRREDCCPVPPQDIRHSVGVGDDPAKLVDDRPQPPTTARRQLVQQSGALLSLPALLRRFADIRAILRRLHPGQSEASRQLDRVIAEGTH